MIKRIKVERSYIEEIPIWKCNLRDCGCMFHIEVFVPSGDSGSWGNEENAPFCPRCGYRNCSRIEEFEFSDD